LFDFRYHALSLAAVLFALALGVLLGVAIGDTNLVSSAKNGVVHNLDAELGQARSQSGKLHEQLTGEEAFANGLYPLAVHELIAGRTIGVVFLGGASNQVNALVRNAVAQAGGQVTTVIEVREPPDLEGLAHDAAGTHFAALAASTPLLQAFGDLIGRQLVSGGPLVDRELVNRVRTSLLSAFDGQLTRLEGLVVVRAEPAGMSAAQSEASTALESGLLAGVKAVGVPAVGVELTGSEPSQIAWYRGKGLSSVDNLDQLAGQAALDYALAGNRGTFGAKTTAESLLPAVNTGAAPAP
jgi:Copper transport outer membrane protein, MctB